MKKLFPFLLLLLSVSAVAQVTSSCQGGPCPAITASGGTVTITNFYGGMNASFEELITGAPATVSITIQGCMAGGTCDTAVDTNTTVAASTVRGVSFPRPYGSIKVTATWTGGTNPTVTVNPIVSSAHSIPNTAPYIATVSTGSGSVTAGAAAAVKVWGFSTPQAVSTSTITYNVSTADNTADVYDICVYDNSGKLVAHTGALPGTTLFPATGARSQAWTATGTIPAGRYYIGFACSAGCTAVVGGGNMGSFAINQTGPAPVSNACVSGTMPADSWSQGPLPAVILR